MIKRIANANDEYIIDLTNKLYIRNFYNGKELTRFDCGRFEEDDGNVVLC